MTWPHGSSMHGSAPGKIRPGAVLFVLMVVALVYLATKFVPPYWTYLSMMDPVKSAAMTMATSRSSDDPRMRTELIRQASENGLTLDNDNIEISQDGSVLTVRLTWVAPVELPWYRYDLHFQIAERVPLR